MNILAHRGLWHDRADGNTLAALTAALDGGFGIEFDVRDADGKLVIAHDIVVGPKPAAEELLGLLWESRTSSTLAFNIKADGLALHVQTLVTSYGLANYFCFDMSVPETLHYRRLHLRYFARHSEHESAPVLYADAAGVWMDMFETDWITASDIRTHLDRGKQVAIVSPELHGRPHIPFWESLRASALPRHAELMLCTDHPDAARSFFNA